MRLIIICIFITTNLYAQNTMLRSRGNTFNPATSINALMLMENHEVDNDEDGFSIQEVEMQFTSDVDAYFRAQVALGIHKERDAHDDEEEEEEEHSEHEDFVLHVEEAYIETINISGHTLRAGQFYVNFGKYNAVHTHALPFIYRPMIQQAVFGGDGLTQAGFGYSTLIPTSWFSELNIQIFEPNNETLFGESKHAMATTARWKNLWDITDNLTLEWGLSGMNYAPKDSEDENSNYTALQGSDLTFKWRPASKSIYHSFIWSTEFLKKYRRGEEREQLDGWMSFMRYQLDRRWYVQAQYESLDVQISDENVDTEAYSALLAFVSSEFSAIRLQYDQIDYKSLEREQRIALQFNISIGAHPAHAY